MLLDGRDHVGQHRGAAGPRDDEQVREAGDGEAEIGARPRGPGLIQAFAAPPSDVHGEQRSRHGVEAGGQDQAVERIARLCRPEARDREFLDGIGLGVQQRHVGPVEGLEVVGVEARALAGEHLLGRQQLGRGRVLHHLADSPTQIVAGGVVGLLADQQVGEGPDELQAPDLPSFVIDRLPLVGARRQGRGRVGVEVCGAPLGVAAGAEALVVGLDPALHLRIQRRVAGRDGIGGRPLEDVELAGLGRDHRDRLQGGRPGADDRHPLAGEVHALMGPGPGVIDGAFEPLEPVDGRSVGLRQAAGGHDQPPRRGFAALVSFN